MQREKGKIAFQLFLIILFQWATITCQLNIYNTRDRTFKSNSLQFDCLDYHVYREKLAYQELSDIVDEAIPYCFRPADDSDESLEVFVDSLFQKLSFEQLREANIPSLQLLSWSVSIDTAERYQFYLNAPDASLNEYFYNCTEPRFGPQCQYLFMFDERMTFNEIVDTTFRERLPYSESSNMMVPTPCYVLLECHRIGLFWCLDWREVCDGKVDCLDEGLDEESCFDMEINECSEDEYRCHNGLCISQELWEDGIDDTECLDRSDNAPEISYINSCFQDPTFRCEEHSCRASSNPFPCGDGQCVRKFETCRNGRHVLLIDSITAHGNLTDECWIAMLCLTGFEKKVNESLCEIWITDNTIYAALETCDSFFQFPVIPVHFDHVRFFYKDVHLRSDLDEFLLPDYICSDQQLCDSIKSDLVYKNFTCVRKPESIEIYDSGKNPWADLVRLIDEEFCCCSIPHVTCHDKTKYSNYPSLYNCQNSAKFISKHRLMDDTQDCLEGDDEEYPDSCQLNDRYRVTCVDKTKCWSPLQKKRACLLNRVGDPEAIQFQSFCDGIEEYFYDSKGNKHSDEFGCGNWSCDNIYTRCDGFWTCSDGRDEDNCNRTICPSHKYACVSPANYTVICLPSTSVNDTIVDCFGALDEQRFCRNSYPPEAYSKRYRCSHSEQCLRVFQLCDQHDDCKSADDEEFCKNQPFTCNQSSAHNRSKVEEVLCGLNEDENRKTKYFAVHTSSNYPSLENSDAAEFTLSISPRYYIRNVDISRIENNVWPWYCNRGLVVRTWIKNNSHNLTCMCPPSYYGHLCQYQNQRISLTLRLTSDDRYATYAVVSMLIDDNGERMEIDSYDQFTYIAKQSCSIKLNRYLLFSTRPKNISKSYSVRIDTFTKHGLTYIGSWHFPINFLFLPVNRLGISLNLSSHLIYSSSNCSITCNNGTCVKYLNKDKYFCRCSPKWSGIQCNIPTNCQACSADSICIGSLNNRSICVCALQNSGQRCLLTSTCPPNACQNNGQCVPADVSIAESNYTCICSDQFFGQNCEHRKAILDVSLHDMYIPSYLVAYFFTLSNQSEPIETTILRKLTLFQHVVTFYIAVPFHLVLIQASDKYYLAVLQQSPKTHMSTLISSKQVCTPTEQLLNSTVLQMVPYQRIIHFHYLCQRHFDVSCFIDKTYLCLCTNDHHANCMKFNRERNFQCPLNNHCANEGQCLQDHPTCPSTKICLCPNCFFGNQCQFYAKGLGSTLDEILGYEFKSNMVLTKQPVTVKVGAAVTLLVFVVGIVNSILSIITFSLKKSRELGCGIYLLVSSVTSLLTMILFTLKFWFLLFSHQDPFGPRSILIGNCFYIEPLLKIFLYLDNWLNACVAIERTVSVYQGITFNKRQSRLRAIVISPILTFIIVCLFIPYFRFVGIFEDKAEERSWCVVTYEPWLQIYSSTMIFFHYFSPLAINIFSTIFIILSTTRQRAISQTDRSFWVHLKSKVKQHDHLFVTSGIIIFLTLPHLIVSVILDCNRSSHLFWFYLASYFLSFMPAAFIFLIFVLPSPLYRQEFKDLLIYIRRRINVFKLNWSRL